MFGHLTCKTCGQHYTTPINSLYHERRLFLIADGSSQTSRQLWTSTSSEHRPAISMLQLILTLSWVDACEEIREKQPKRERFALYISLFYRSSLRQQRPVRGISPLKHGAQGGANLKFTNGDDEDEDEDEDEYGDRSRPAAPGHTESELEESNSSDEGSGERRRTHGDEKGYEGRRQPMAPGHDEMDEDDYRSRKRRRG